MIVGGAVAREREPCSIHKRDRQRSEDEVDSDSEEAIKQIEGRVSEAFTGGWGGEPAAEGGEAGPRHKEQDRVEEKQQWHHGLAEDRMDVAGFMTDVFQRS